MGVARKLIDWCDTKFEEAVREDSGRKAFVSGVVEGAMDAAIVMYIPVVIGCYIWKHMATKQ